MAGILDEYMPRGPQPFKESSSEREAIEQRGGLITTMGVTALMLDLRFKDGRRKALPYGYLTQVDLDPSADLTIAFTACQIKITGRNLDAVYKAILNHTALAIIEAGEQFDDGQDVPFVETITVGSAPSTAD